jgi:hypothetical protein
MTWNHSWRFVLILLAVGAGCDTDYREASCQKTTGNFVAYFNRQDFRAVVSLFQPRTLSGQEISRSYNNLEYIHGVAGVIRSIRFDKQIDNRIIYKSIHENTVMDIIFRVNERCQLVSYQIDTHYPDSLPQIERNTTSMRLPFQGEWHVEWGGPGLEENYHNAHRNMQGAFDFVKKDQQGKSYTSDGKKNLDYFAFGQPVVAPCQATVVKVIDGIEDNDIGRTNDRQTYGNVVVLQTVEKEYLLLAHLQEHSIVVNEGQEVNRGDLLGLCGNSGYSTQPHLHFMVQNVADLFHPTGATCFFDSINVNGVLKQDYSPVRGELVGNLNSTITGR